MARQEEPREDLLREATALIERAELRVPGLDEPLVIGFRRSGSGSIYLGDETAYQFNARGELRRGYAGGQLIKAEAGRLVALRRQRSAREVALVRHEFPPEETAAFLAGCRQLLDRLHSALCSGSYELVGVHPPGADVAGRIEKWLASLPAQLAIAASPRAGG